jgi:lactoylglutathione lyase
VTAADAPHQPAASSGPDVHTGPNHIGLCVTDLARSRHFYEEALGFRTWWELQPPDEAVAPLLQLPAPLQLHAVYLVLGDLVLELLAYDAGTHPGPRARPMDEPGLTHLSFAVDDLDAAVARVIAHGGHEVEGTRSAAAVMVRDPDGQLLELTSPHWRRMAPPRPS